MPSASELLGSLQETLGLRKKKPTETPAAPEMPAAPPPAPALEPAPTTMPPESAVTEAPPAQELAPAGGLPDWLSAPPAVEPIPTPTPESAVAPAVTPDWLKGGSVPLAPLPEPEAPVVEAPVAPAAESPAPVLEAPSALPVVEATASFPEAKAETDPFSTNKEFNGYMDIIRQAQAVLASGIALTPEEQKKALIAVARSNSLLPKLPPEVLESVLLMRAVASGNPKFGRDDFQIEMLAAMDVIKTGTTVKG